MADSPENDPVFWRAKAKEARMLADKLQDAMACQHMLSAALCYDRLAELAEQSLAREQTKQKRATDAA